MIEGGSAQQTFPSREAEIEASLLPGDATLETLFVQTGDFADLLRNICIRHTENNLGKYYEPYWQALFYCRRYALLEMPSTCEYESQHQTSPLPREVGTVTAVPRILLADDQEEMLQTVNLILSDDFTVVGSVDNGLRAVDLAMTLRPDVLVLDISMPVVDGLEAARRLEELGSCARIIFLTVHVDCEFVEAALSAGALGYVLKPCLASELVPAIWTVLQGNIFVSPSMQLK
jgi:CheY-like chemotaxis protein